MHVDAQINNENYAYELDVEMDKGHANYAHSKQAEMSNAARCLLESGEEHATIMYIHD